MKSKLQVWADNHYGTDVFGHWDHHPMLPNGRHTTFNLHSSRKLRTACCHYEMSTHTALYGISSQPGALSNVQCCRADLSSAKVKGTVLLSSMEGSRGCCAPRVARIRSTRLLTRRKCRTSKASKCKDAASRNAHAIGACTQIAATGASFCQVTTEVQCGKSCCGNDAGPCGHPHEDKPIVYAHRDGAKMTNTGF